MCGVPGEAFVFNEFYIESPTGYSYFDFTTEPGGNSLDFSDSQFSMTPLTNVKLYARNAEMEP